LKGRSASANKRLALLGAGQELFSRHGYREVSIEEVARAAGMGTGSFYTYFSSKESFYEEILDQLESEGIAAVDRLVSGFESPLNKMKALYRFTTLGVRKNPILMGVLTGDRKYVYPGQKGRRERKPTLRTHVEELMDGIIEEGRRKGVFRARLFRDPRGLLLALYDALLLRLGSGQAEELMDDVLVLLERGMKRRVRLPGNGTLRDRRQIGRRGADGSDPGAAAGHRESMERARGGADSARDGER
jgi:AcrR family transcriptional regulator